MRRRDAGRLDNRIQRAFFPSTFYSARPMISTSKNSFSLFLPLRSLKNNKFPFPIFLWRSGSRLLSLSQISIESSFKKRVLAPAGDEEKITGGCHSDGEQRSKSCCAALRKEKEDSWRVRLTASAAPKRLCLGRLNKLIDSSLASQLMSPIKIADIVFHVNKPRLSEPNHLFFCIIYVCQISYIQNIRLNFATIANYF